MVSCAQHVSTRLEVKQYLWGLTLRSDRCCVSSGLSRCPFPLLCLLPWMDGAGPLPLRGDWRFRAGPRSLPPLTHFQCRTTSMTFTALQGRVVHLQGKQTNMEAAGVQVYRPCSFECLWVWHHSISNFVAVQYVIVYGTLCVQVRDSEGSFTNSESFFSCVLCSILVSVVYYFLLYRYLLMILKTLVLQSRTILQSKSTIIRRTACLITDYFL